jgi:hypothetical protein
MQETPPLRKHDWISIFQAGFSLLGSFLLWGLAFLILFFGLVNLATNSIDRTNFEAMFLLIAGLVVCGFLLLPSAGYSLAHVINHPLPTINIKLPYQYMGLVILAMPVVLVIGHWLTRQPGFGGILLPVFHILALGIPILWMIYLGLRHLPTSSLQRRWGLFSFGLTVTPGLILVIELIVMIVFIFVAVILLSSNQDFMNEIYQLSQKLNNGTIYPEEVYSEILPYLSHPVVFFLAIAFTSVIVPLIEEAIKPLGVWFLVGRKVAPSEGFVAGLLCGAGYGLLENIALTYASQDWAITVTGRMGTSLIHMATASLTGWALVCAWNQKKYLQLGGAYLLAVIIHGMWNGLAISYGFAALLNKNAPILVGRLGLVAPLGLFVLATAAFLLIILSNHRLQKQSIPVSSNTFQPQIQE